MEFFLSLSTGKVGNLEVEDQKIIGNGIQREQNEKKKGKWIISEFLRKEKMEEGGGERRKNRITQTPVRLYGFRLLIAVCQWKWKWNVKQKTNIKTKNCKSVRIILN